MRPSGTDVPLQAGQLLCSGAYRVVRPLGKGGMGATWLVAQTKAFDRLAVLKEIIEYYDPADPAARQEAIDRFEAEARTLADLKHPGIPDLYAYFSEGGRNYLVEEYIEGPDLSKGLTREDGTTGRTLPGGPLPVEQALQYTIQVCEVLEYLASRQPPIVHNDIKPGNILIDNHSGRAVLVDFGTARAHQLRAAASRDPRGLQAGGQGDLYGTIGYAAPELYRGHSEPRSDVYSLAATAYHLLTDDDPGDHPGQYPQLASLPPALADILQAALDPDVTRRPTAGELRERLATYLAGQTAPLRALAFPGGEAAADRNQLLALAVKHWNYAAGLLQDGTLARWLQQTLRDPPAARAAETAVQNWPGDPDAALDAWVRQLDPTRMPPGQMELRTPRVHLSVGPQATGAGAGAPVRQTIEIANRGQGYLRGEVFTTQPWVRVNGNAFGCPPGGTHHIVIDIHPSGLTPGQAHVAAVTLTPVGGTPEVVPIQVTVLDSLKATGSVPAPDHSAAAGPPAIRVRPDRIDLSATPPALSTDRRQLTVTNIGPVPVRCQVSGAPPWLIVTPDSFVLKPGGERAVELVGRVAKVQGRRQDARLMVTPEAYGLQASGAAHAVRVTVQIRGGGLFG